MHYYSIIRFYYEISVDFWNSGRRVLQTKKLPSSTEKIPVIYSKTEFIIILYSAVGVVLVRVIVLVIDNYSNKSLSPKGCLICKAINLLNYFSNQSITITSTSRSTI